MENLEETKRLCAEFKKINKVTCKYSSFILISSLRIYKLVADKLMIRDKITPVPTPPEMYFLISLINRKEPFSIEGIRLDLLKGMCVSDVALKYCEPEEVITEILNKNFKSESDIVSSKLYDVNEISVFFKKNLSISEIPILKDISSKKYKESIFWWTGADLINNYENIINFFNKKTDPIKIGNKKYITVDQAANLLRISRLAILFRINIGKNIFGVKIPIKKIKLYGSSVYRLYLPLEEVNVAKNNIKYYIKQIDFFNYETISDTHRKRIRKQYLITYHKKIDFSNKYLRKESLENFITLAEQYGYKREDLIKKD